MALEVLFVPPLAQRDLAARLRCRKLPNMASKPPRSWTPSRPERRGAPPATLGEVLVGAQDFLAKQTGAALTRDEWRRIVGARIAGRTRVGRLYRGLLTVRVASSAWSSELSFLKSDLLRKLVRAGHDIDDLRFVVDQFTEPADTPRPFQRKKPVPSPLPQELQEKLRKVEDPNLRAAIAQAARYSLAPKGSTK